MTAPSTAPTTVALPTIAPSTAPTIAPNTAPVGTITVTGGASGIAAQTEDLRALARTLSIAQATIGDVRYALESPALILRIESPVTTPDADHRRQIVAQLAGFAGVLDCLQQDLIRLYQALLSAAAGYDEADGGVLDSLAGLLAAVAATVADLVMFDPSGAREHLYDGLPYAVGLGMAGGQHLEPVYTALVPDGRPVVLDEGLDPTETRAPTRLSQLIAELAHRDDGEPGEISVSTLVAADGTRRVIVDIPGTKSWNPFPNPDVTSVGTDLRALAAAETSYEDGVFLAMRAAGVRPGDKVMLVGHSEGGIIAVDAARDAGESGEFDITHVVTAGAPIGQLVSGLPARVQVLALENSADIVPATDAAANPDEPNVTTVIARIQHSSIGENHSLEDSYLPETVAAEDGAETIEERSVEAFIDSAADYLEGVHMDTRTFRITRALR